MDDSERKGWAMREKENSGGGEKYEDMSHCTTVSFFPDLSLQWPVPGEKDGDGAAGRNEEKEREMRDLKRDKGVDRERVGHCDVRPGG